jgi:hypothetical protein
MGELFTLLITPELSPFAPEATTERERSEWDKVGIQD